MKKNDLEKFDFRTLDASTLTIMLGFSLDAIKSSYSKLIHNDSIISATNKLNTYKDIIYLYEFYKNKIEELEYRCNPQFNLVHAKSNKTYDSILAKVKWNYPYKGKVRKKEFITIFITSTKNFPKGLKEPYIEEYAREKIYKILYKNAPIELIDTDLNPYTI